MKLFIYKLTAPNGKSYIGQTYDFRKRLNEHKSSRSIIGSALRKYGIENFGIEFLWSTIDPAVADRIEIAAIQYYNSLISNGYNIKPGGRAPRGWHHSQESKKKISITMAGNRNGINSPGFSGRHHSQESKKKIRSALLGREKSEEHKQKIGEGNKGKKRIDFSNRMKRMWKDPEYRKRMAKINSTRERNRLPRETRICAAPGCEISFECKISSEQKYCQPGHTMKGRKHKKKNNWV